MIAVVARADQPELFNIVRTLFHAWTEAGRRSTSTSRPPAWEQVEKFDLDDPFWEMVKAAFGYERGQPLAEEPPAPAAADRLRPPPEGRRAAAAPGRLRPAPHRLVQRRRLPGPVAGQQQQGEQLRPALRRGGRRSSSSSDHLRGLEIDHLLDVMTFLAVEKRIASGLRERVQATADTINADDVRAVATRRQAGHWASPTVAGAPEVPRKALHAVYDALVAAADFFALRNQHRAGFDFPDAASHVPGLRVRTSSASTSCTATSARPPTWPRRRAGTSSSRCGPTWRRATSTGI